MWNQCDGALDSLRQEQTLNNGGNNLDEGEEEGVEGELGGGPEQEGRHL